MINILFDKEQLQRLKLYNEGKTDNEIAEERKITLNAVKLWRKIYKLNENIDKNKEGE